jgi:threonine aldolase
MSRYFKSDNTAAAAPEILAALAAANLAPARAYGDDAWTARLDAAFGALFDHEVRVFPVATGTAANSLALATLVPPWGAILAHEGAHVVRDECGAPEFMSGGARLLLVPGAGGKLAPDALRQALADNPPTVHTVQPRAITLTQATELGTVYRPAEVAAIGALAREHGLALHVDGARFANAVAFLGCHPAELTWRAGVDVLSFGATKNGALGAEAVVFFDPARVADFELRRKRAGALLSKMRYVSAQLLACIDRGLWLRLASSANAHATRVGAAAGTRLRHPVEGNEVFITADANELSRLRAAGFEFYDWGPAHSGEARLVVSWDQPEEDVDALVEALSSLPPPPAHLDGRSGGR